MITFPCAVKQKELAAMQGRAQDAENRVSQLESDIKAKDMELSSMKQHSEALQAEKVITVFMIHILPE